MSKFLLSFCFISLFACLSYSQLLEGSVEDPEGNPIILAKIIDTNQQVITYTDELGKFKIEQKENEVFGVQKTGFKLRWYNIGENLETDVFIMLEYHFLEIQEVSVVSKGPEEALDINSVNIIDYQPFDKQILTLKKDRQQYYIGLDSIGVEGPRFPFSEERPKRLFLDCFGNMHIVCNQNVYQFVVSPDTLIILEVTPKADFQLYLENCIADFDNGLVIKKLSKHNQLYELTLYEEGKGKQVYQQFDPVTLEIASEEALFAQLQYNEDMAGDSLNENILTTRQALRKIHQGANPDVEMDFMIKKNKGSRISERVASYKLFSYPIDVRSFQLNNYLCVIDFETNKVSLFDNTGNLAQSSDFSILGDIREIWKDHYTNGIYLFASTGGNHVIYSLDVLTGETTFIKNLRDLPFVESEKVHNGWMYYREIENGYFNINRIKLPDYSLNDQQANK